MDEFKDYQVFQSNTSKGRTQHFTTKDLLHLGSLLIGIIGLLTSSTGLPVWAYWLMAIYLVIALIIISVLPAKNFISNRIKQLSQGRFAKNKRTELQELSNELNELLEDQRDTTIPYFLSHKSSTISTEVNLLKCLERSRQQFAILQSWAWALSDNLNNDNPKLFLRDAIQFSRVVSWFTWACVWIQQVLNITEVREKIPKEVVSDWNLSVQRISDFTSRVTRTLKSINNKYNTGNITISFQDVKLL